MRIYESRHSKYIDIVLNGGGTWAIARIVDELPEVGDVYDGCAVLEVSPYPLTRTDQKDLNVWQYAIWNILLADGFSRYIAIHEEEAEKM